MEAGAAGAAAGASASTSGAPRTPTRRPDASGDAGRARDVAVYLRSTGAKLVCIDFDATFVSVHTSGRWTRSARELRRHVRGFFLALVPRLLDADVHVAVVTFSPQVALILEVLALCFPSDVIRRLIVRGDDDAWSLVHAETLAFMPLWQTNGRHLDRKFKLPFMISAARELSRRLEGEPVRNHDTVLIDDDAMNIRVANDSGVVGLYFDPEDSDATVFCRRIRKLQTQTHTQRPDQTVAPPTPMRTPCKTPPVRLRSTPNSKFLSSRRRSGARRRLGTTLSSAGDGGRASNFSVCTPSPVMKLQYNVDMGRPRSKRATRMMRNCSRNIEVAMPELATASSPTTPVSTAEPRVEPRVEPSSASLPGEIPVTPIKRPSVRCVETPPARAVRTPSV